MAKHMGTNADDDDDDDDNDCLKLLFLVASFG